MNAVQFAAYLEEAIPAYAKGNVESGRWSEAESLALSQQSYAGLLPQGLATPNNYLYAITSVRLKVAPLAFDPIWWWGDHRLLCIRKRKHNRP